MLTSRQWRTDCQPYLQSWLRGTEKNLAVLQSFCGDPVITGQQESLSIRCNFANVWGAIEQWTFTVRVGTTMEVTHVTIEKIRPNGTFNVMMPPG